MAGRTHIQARGHLRGEWPLSVHRHEHLRVRHPSTIAQSRHARRKLVGFDEAGQEAFVNRQVLREYLSVVTRPGLVSAPVAIAEAIQEARRLELACTVLEDGPEVSRLLFDLLERFPTSGKQVHDVNIVATMLAYGVRDLLTDNVADFARFRATIEVIPLHE